MKKAISLKLDPTLLNELDKLTGSRTGKIEKAIQSYIRSVSNEESVYIPGNTLGNTNPGASETIEDMKALSDMKERYEERLNMKDELLKARLSEIDSLKSSLGWALSEFSQLQKVALPAPQEDPQEKRKWRLWKKK
ncbi:MAG: hypothetical protein IMF19_09050 [Proteobacteria bacterium]|nr:hypothetical protein [Pseudomonadota bacterium]